jgi:hypothetical protein
MVVADSYARLVFGLHQGLHRFQARLNCSFLVCRELDPRRGPASDRIYSRRPRRARQRRPRAQRSVLRPQARTAALGLSSRRAERPPVGLPGDLHQWAGDFGREAGVILE